MALNLNGMFVLEFLFFLLERNSNNSSLALSNLKWIVILILYWFRLPLQLQAV